jgi:hypothetical protein
LVILMQVKFVLRVISTRGSRALRIAETESIWVVTCCGFKLANVCINLERTEYHAVDAGFWVALEVVIRWIRFRTNLIDLFVGNVCSFFMDPESAVQPYSVMFLHE